MKGTILVVDDSTTIRHRTRQLLEKSQGDDLVVWDAKDGAEALLRLASLTEMHMPDCIVLDRNMPQMSGDETIFILKKDPLWARIPVLFLTAQADKDQIVHGLSRLQAEDYLPKPFDAGEFVARVKVLIRIKQAEDQLKAMNTQLEAALEEQRRAYAELKATKVKLAETEVIAAMTKVFEKFVPKQFPARIATDGLEHVELGRVVREKITILFSDLRSFTTLSEQMTPEEVFHFLNEFLSRMEPYIKQNGGFVDKYIGDAIMALFDNLDEEIQVCGSVVASLGMLRGVSTYNEERVREGKVPIEIGVGVHTGHVMIGTLGSHNRMDSTAIGDAVNTASRLEGLTKFYGVSFIVSDSVLQQLPKRDDFLFVRPVDYIAVKGKKQPISVYELYAADPLAQRETKFRLSARFEQGVTAYRNQEFTQALADFEACAEALPEDKLYKIYKQRCREFIEHPPPPTWDGVYIAKEK